MASVFPLLVLVLSIACSSLAHGHGHGHHDRHGREEHEHYHVVETSSLQPKSTCSGHKVMPSSSGTWVPLHRPYGPCSPTPSPTGDTPSSSLIEMLNWDKLHTEYIRRKATTGNENVFDPYVTSTMMQVEFRLQGGFGLGTQPGDSSAAAGMFQPTAAGDPTASQTMSIDTSVDVPWVQCVPCPPTQCYPQQDSLYDPSTSNTSAAVACGSAACAALGRYGNGCSNSSSQCKYLIDYGDGRATAGTYMSDTLTLTPTSSVPNFRFGCSHAARGHFSSLTSGIMSLGGGQQSLLSQTAATFGNAFSYCVPQPSSSGFLSLGGPTTAGAPPASFGRTPLVRNVINPSMYLVLLQGITVGGQPLNVPRVAFSAGTIMDSSTVITQLPPTAYHALRLAFRTAMAMYPLTTSWTPRLDTCYDFLGFTNVTLPVVTLVFNQGAVVTLGPEAIMMEGCLAFTATDSDFTVGVLGNVQQQTHEVLYDVGGSNVGFRSGAC